LKVYKA